MHPITFILIAALLIAGALGVVLLSSPIRSAMSLVATLFVMAVTFLLLDAHLVAALQIIVYAGAIMVLFLFVIMLLNLQDDARAMAHAATRAAAVTIGSLIVLLAIAYSVRFGADAQGMIEGVPSAFGTTEMLAEILFTRFLFAFEATSLLLLVAIIGAVVLAKKSLS